MDDRRSCMRDTVAVGIACRLLLLFLSDQTEQDQYEADPADHAADLSDQAKQRRGICGLRRQGGHQNEKYDSQNEE